MSSLGVSDSASTPSAARASGESGTAFAVRGKTPPPGEISAGVVVGPGRARQLEEPLALGEARRRVRIRIEEDVPVVERADQLDVTGEQHAVAEHVAGHVADPDNGEVGGLDVGSQLAEVALDRLPGATGRDPHLLVVVAGGAAGGEGVAEPEAVLDRDRVRDVREGRRALVGGDDEVRVVLVVADDVRRRHDLAAGDRVRHVEQAAHERPVALDDLLEQRSAVATGRRPLDDEAALGADRDDDGVLDRLRLHQPEHLGAEVLAAVRPADAAARDPARRGGARPRRGASRRRPRTSAAARAGPGRARDPA